MWWKKKEYRAFRNLENERRYEFTGWKDHITQITQNGRVHVLYPNHKEPSAELHRYITKMSEHGNIPKIKSTKQYRRTAIAMSLAGYLSKDFERRQNAVELAQKFPYNHLRFCQPRLKTVKSLGKWIAERKTGYWKIIGFGKPQTDIREHFVPTVSAFIDEHIPDELYSAIPLQIAQQMELEKKVSLVVSDSDTFKKVRDRRWTLPNSVSEEVSMKDDFPKY